MILKLPVVKIFLVLSLISLLLSCQNGNTNAENFDDSGQSIGISIAVSDSIITVGKTTEIRWRLNDSLVNADSVVLYSDGKRVQVFQGAAGSTEYSCAGAALGKHIFSVKVFLSGRKGEAATSIFVASDLVPEQYKVKVLKTYPHSRETYTQGLIYRDGYFFESGGEYGSSALKKVLRETGAAEKMAVLESNVFAEGIAIKGEELYQISWREQVCFVYNVNTFVQLRRFLYDIREGWGLEYNGREFLMTDGSNTLYFLDAESFAVLRKVEVMDHEGPVHSLNELELVNRKLYANVYMTDKIVEIDLLSGKVTGVIDASGLLQKSDYQPGTDVLNGIAYNPESGHFYITGKRWPKLFEVVFVPVKK